MTTAYTLEFLKERLAEMDAHEADVKAGKKKDFTGDAFLRDLARKDVAKHIAAMQPVVHPMDLAAPHEGSSR